MTNTSKRILVGAIMAALGGGAAALEYFGIPAVKYLAVAIAAVMLFEFAFNVFKPAKKKGKKSSIWLGVIGIAYLLFLFAPAAYHIGGRPWIILLMLLIIVFADIGAWFFGRLIGGDKMWENLSPNKTWAGQIAGIICGTFASVMYGLLGTDTFLPQLLWIGISVALLSQYGDLTASWVKRKIGIKDFGNILPGHGGALDRFDGWIYVLPIIWLVMM